MYALTWPCVVNNKRRISDAKELSYGCRLEIPALVYSQSVELNVSVSYASIERQLRNIYVASNLESSPLAPSTLDIVMSKLLTLT